MHEGESRLFLPVIWITGFIRRARVVLVQSRQKKSCTRFYYGRTDQLDWDPNRFKWGNTIPFMAYAAAMGRGLLKKKHIVPEVVPSKWQGIIQANYRLKWLNVWDKERGRMKPACSGSFGTERSPWMLGEDELAIALINAVRSICVASGRPCCTAFGNALQHKGRGNGAIILCAHSEEPPPLGTMVSSSSRGAHPRQERTDRKVGIPLLQFSPTWKHCIFTHRTPRRFKKVSRLWLLLRSTVT